MSKEVDEFLDDINQLQDHRVIKNLISKNRISGEKISFAKYNSLSRTDLLLVSITILNKFRKDSPKTKVSVEEWVIQAHNLFPLSFYFSLKWPIWPHVEKIGRVQRILRGKGYVKGSPKLGYSLTNAGLKKATSIANYIYSASSLGSTDNLKLKGSASELQAIAKFVESSYFVSWDELSSPVELSLNEIADLIRIPAGSKSVKFANKILSLVQEGGDLSIDIPEIRKARKFLVIQANYQTGLLGTTEYKNSLKKITNSLDLTGFTD